MGNWSQPPELALDGARWPDGLLPLSDAVKESGLEFILWFVSDRSLTPGLRPCSVSTHLQATTCGQEPERAAPDTWLRRLYPEWMLGDNPHANALLNLGDPEARGYITDYISSAIDAFGLSVFRTDYNIQPLALFLGPPYPDDATRRGSLEAKYVDGLYTFWDTVRHRNGGILVDNCASTYR